ncbi:MAG: hypothetical protein OXC68_03795 [Aestuariivita sp.]|nr:hypothetical protein [Aestuariivita sp.]
MGPAAARLWPVTGPRRVLAGMTDGSVTRLTSGWNRIERGPVSTGVPVFSLSNGGREGAQPEQEKQSMTYFTPPH